MRRWLKWGALGLGLVLLLGALAVFVFPSAIANGARGWIEKEFAERFHGRLALGEMELAWNGPQTLRSVELFDERGQRILAATIVAPSIRRLIDGRQLGRARVEFEADLVADDAGSTNLERALAPRDSSTSAPADESDEAEPTDWRERLAELDLEVELVAQRLTYSDARTRAAGRPIALANLAATAKLAHGERAELALVAELQDGEPRRLTLDAALVHPLAAPDSATPPSLELAADLRQLPTGLIDGLAGLGGTLTRVLGPQVSFTAKGGGTAQSGALEFALEAPRARVAGNFALADGVLRGVGPTPLSAEIEVDQAVLDEFVAPRLPTGTALERRPSPRVGLRLDEGFELDLARILDALARGEDLGPLVPSAIRGGARVELGDWRVRDAARELDVGVGGVFAALARGASDQDPPVDADAAPWGLRAGFRLEGAPAPSSLQVGTLDASELAAVASGGGLTGASWSLDVPEIPAALLAAFGAPAIDGLRVKAQGTLSLASRAAPGPWGAADLERVTSRTELSGEARRVVLSDEMTLGATQASISLRTAGGLVLEARGRARLDAARESVLALDVQTSDGLARLANGELPPATVKLGAHDLPIALVDRLSGGTYALAERLGPSATLELRAEGDLANSTLGLELVTQRARLVADLVVAERRLTLGQGGARLEAEVDAGTVAELVGPSLPAGCALEPMEGAQRVVVDVTRLATALDAWLSHEPGEPLDLAAAVATTQLAARLELGDWSVREAALTAAGQSLDLGAWTLELELSGSPGAAPARLTFGASIAGVTDGGLALRADVANALELLALSETRTLGPVALELEVPALPVAFAEAYTGPLGGKFGERVGLKLGASAEWPRGARVKSRVDLELAAATPTKVEIDATLADPFASLEQGALPEAELELEVSQPALALAFVPAEYRELASEALGAKFGLNVANRASSGGKQSFSVALDAPGAKLDVAGVLEGRTFRAVGSDRIAASLPLHSKTLEPLLKTYLPAGVEVALVTDGEAVAFSASELEVPLDAWLPAPGAEPEALSVALDRAKAKLEASLPAVRVRAPAVTANGAPVDVTLRSLALTGVELAPGRLVGARVTGTLDATPPGSIAVALSGEHPFGLLDDRGGALKPRLLLDGELNRIPTALIDALAAQDGLIVDVLGAGADIKLHGTWPPEGADALTAEMHSPNADFKVRANAKDGVLTSTGEQGLDASLIVTPLFGERVVGSLVPLIADVRQVEGSKRALLSGRNFALPLSGDLRQLNGEITLDPGALEYRFLPGISELFGDAGAKAMSSAKLDPVQVQIVKGVARYERLALPLGGKTYTFKGSFDLVERAYKLETELPLSLLGKSVAKSLEDAADFLDPQTKIPIEIRGTSAKPKLRIADGFLKKALEDAAGKALEKKLKDLLDGDKDKKKKKKPQ